MLIISGGRDFVDGQKDSRDELNSRNLFRLDSCMEFFFLWNVGQLSLSVILSLL
jgi:hypothetical protein